MSDWSGSSRSSRFAQAFATQLDAIGVVDDAIENGVGQSGISHEFIPAVDRKLAGDDQGTSVVAILDDLQQITLLLGQQRFGSPIIEYEQVDAAELAHQLGVTTITTAQSQQGKQARDALIEHREVLPARLEAEGASQPRFAHATRAGQETVAVLADPVTSGEFQEQSTVETARCAVVDILYGGQMAQLCGSGAPRIASAVAGSSHARAGCRATPCGREPCF